MPDDSVAFDLNEIAYGEPRPPGAAFLPIKANQSGKSILSINIKLSSTELKNNFTQLIPCQKEHLRLLCC